MATQNAYLQTPVNYILIKKEYVSLVRQLTNEEVKQTQMPAVGISRKMFFETPQTVPLLQHVRFRLKVPGQPGMYLCHGIVTRVQEFGSSGALSGIGVDLLEMQGASAASVSTPVAKAEKAVSASVQKPATPAKTSAQPAAKSINGGRIVFVLAANSDPAGTPSVAMPRTDAVLEMIKGLLQKDITMSLEGKPLELAAPQSVVVGVYADTEGRVKALLVCDLKFTCTAAGALAMLPKKVVDEAISSGTLSEVISENINEILNVASSLFNAPSAPHMKLKTVVQMISSPCPDDVKLLLSKPGNRLDLELAIPGYD